MIHDLYVIQNNVSKINSSLQHIHQYLFSIYYLIGTRSFCPNYIKCISCYTLIHSRIKLLIIVPPMDQPDTDVDFLQYAGAFEHGIFRVYIQYNSAESSAFPRCSCTRTTHTKVAYDAFNSLIRTYMCKLRNSHVPLYIRQ